MEKVINGVAFRAVRVQRPRPHWRYEIAGKQGPQGYESRPKMWADLERAARFRSEQEWKLEWERFAQ
jgi:hypothetical protein